MGNNGVPVLVTPAHDSSGALIPCTECAHCCTYVAVGVNAPTTTRRASDILWFLYHEKMCVYRSDKGDWFVQFDTRCKNLRGDGLCGIYEHRPHMCRDFKEISCEVNATDEATYFHTPQDFFDYLKRTRKKIYRALEGTYLPSSFPGESERRALRHFPVTLRKALG